MEGSDSIVLSIVSTFPQHVFQNRVKTFYHFTRLWVVGVRLDPLYSHQLVELLHQTTHEVCSTICKDLIWYSNSGKEYHQFICYCLAVCLQCRVTLFPQVDHLQFLQLGSTDSPLWLLSRPPVWESVDLPY